MMKDKNLKILNIGTKWFYDALVSQGVKNVVNLAWQPKLIASNKIALPLDKLLENRQLVEKINKANTSVVDKFNSARPYLIDIELAGKVIPNFKRNLILHAGPPIDYNSMCGPMKAAVLGAIVYEGLANSLQEAEKLIAKGKIEFAPCHHFSAVGPMAGIISYSMPVWVVKNLEFGNVAFSNINEGLGKVLRFGANSPEVISRLKWIKNVLYPIIKKALRLAVKKQDGVDIKNLTSQALLMGDECHNRNVAGTGLFLKEILPYLCEIDIPKKKLIEVIKFISANPHFYLNISMAACKSTADVVEGTKYSSIVYTMARNGVEIGIRVAGLSKEWFTTTAGIPKGLYFPGYSEKDANLDLGDSTISETVGIGAFAMAAAPAIVKFVGGTPEDAVKYNNEMYDITYGVHKTYLIPQFNFRGTPLGIDILKIVKTGITPFINTGIAHKEPGVGQIGAGILHAPIECFIKAFEKFINVYLKD
ncbi:MAG: DUF1116 domain-containing protein [Endomicrobia bacterium]|nr:DUF1116 domain-containing protein [Endomicrobiia bacterium]